MILTDKCDDAFFKWLFDSRESYFTSILFGDEQDLLDEYDSLPISCKYALIVDFFDSVGIKCYSSFDYWDENFDAFVVDENKTYHLGEFNLRNESIIETIKKANDIFNEINN